VRCRGVLAEDLARLMVDGVQVVTRNADTEVTEVG
jgi:hypothetical protein